MMTKIPPLAKLMDAMRDAYEEFSAGHAYVADVQHVHVEPHDDDEGGEQERRRGFHVVNRNCTRESTSSAETGSPRVALLSVAPMRSAR